MSLSGLYRGALPAALLFDLDGTLIDSAPDLAASVDAMLRGLELAPAGEAKVRLWIGNGAPILVRRALADGLKCAPDSLDEALFQRAMEQFFELYQAMCCQSTRLYDGVTPALQEFHRRGVALACVTNKPARFTRELLRYFSLQQYFPVVLSGDSLAVKKPDATPLRVAAAELDVSLEYCAMVGDSATDVMAARNAGIAAIAVSYGYTRGRGVAELGADIVVDDLRQLLA